LDKSIGLAIAIFALLIAVTALVFTFSSENGIDGLNGLNGINGIDGVSFNATLPFTYIFNGSDGIQGIQGIQGIKGDTGNTGSQGIQGIQGLSGSYDQNLNTTGQPSFLSLTVTGGITAKSVLEIDSSSSGNGLIYSYVVGESYNRFNVYASGTIYWGSGSSQVDTNLYRSSANTLKTDDALYVTDGIIIPNNIAYKTVSTTGNTVGILFADNADNVYIRPVKSGGSIKFYSYSTAYNNLELDDSGNLKIRGSINLGINAVGFGESKIEGFSASDAGLRIRSNNGYLVLNSVSDGIIYLGETADTGYTFVRQVGGLVVSGTITGKYMSGDYGALWGSISLPSGANGMMLTAYNSNSGVLSSRFYIYSNSAWHYIALT
jgi:hypothetical protein